MDPWKRKVSWQFQRLPSEQSFRFFSPTQSQINCKPSADFPLKQLGLTRGYIYPANPCNYSCVYNNWGVGSWSEMSIIKIILLTFSSEEPRMLFGFFFFCVGTLKIGEGGDWGRRESTNNSFFLPFSMGWWLLFCYCHHSLTLPTHTQSICSILSITLLFKYIFSHIFHSSHCSYLHSQLQLGGGGG